MKPKQPIITPVQPSKAWNMPNNDLASTGGGMPSGSDLNDLHTAPAASGPKGHEKHMKEHEVLHAPQGNAPTLNKGRPSGY